MSIFLFNKTSPHIYESFVINAEKIKWTIRMTRGIFLSLYKEKKF